ncbi:hypothetical protein [Mesorhizobium sp.]|uniref:hypothetical protein n=1 Tax=Mesorhizobium sp. TaxID=1871066 RepID=UPI001213B43F|nr:hypothetical protein [Mesorhizobium sp.]TIP84938.1 MAG: hypothetical protein E5X63_16550 [Mesorhizobium sp.]TIP93546.1 MAG: hypothetical protein E5X58_10705 [Mesorhizobium sp.]TJW51798.1 MAG: hypothetical protein E5X65_21155 [Mesorhizobium sp.]
MELFRQTEIVIEGLSPMAIKQQCWAAMLAKTANGRHLFSVSMEQDPPAMVGSAIVLLQRL